MMRTIKTSILAVLLITVPFPVAAMDEKHWSFKVYLDGKEIGFHNYHLTEVDGIKRVVTEADFRVRFLFFTAYEYQHTNTEVWDGECLQAIESQTDVNGEKYTVDGRRAAQAFELRAGDEQAEMHGCIKTFAYWDPQFLQASRLLNAQTGELMSVTVEEIGKRELNVQGEATLASGYRVLARDVDLQLWYDEHQRWLALQSITKDGRLVRYELTQAG